MKLTLETKIQTDKTPIHSNGNITILVTPQIDEEYWAYRVRLTEDQAIIGFPKFATIGIGFEKEEDWNTNFPWWVSSKEIYEHIKRNKGKGGIKEKDCITAIKIIREAVYQNLSEEDRARYRKLNPNLIEEA